VSFNPQTRKLINDFYSAMIHFSAASPRRRKLFRNQKQRDGIGWIAIGIWKQGTSKSARKPGKRQPKKSPARVPESCDTQLQEVCWRGADLMVLGNPAEQSFGFAFDTLQALAEQTPNK